MRQIRVLLVDDSPEFLSAASGFLSRDPRVQIVGCACNGQEGVRLAQELAPDLVLMDLAMPVMDGLEATFRIKSLPAAPHIVIVSLHQGPEYQSRARKAQADGFICKSDFTEGLLALLGGWFLEKAKDHERDTDSRRGELKK